MMLARTRARRRRPGFVLVEAAFVYPAFLGLTIGGVLLGLSIFRHQEISHLARESARWTSLQDPSLRTPEQIRAEVLTPMAMMVDPDNLQVETTSTADTTTVTITYPRPSGTAQPASPEPSGAAAFDSALFTIRARARVRNPY
jgi:Flp pilus assembly protein TadG